MEQIRTDVTGSNWREPYNLGDALTVPQTCRANQELIRPASRVLFCGRCGHATSGTQGHTWLWCNAQGKKMNDLHFCCPQSCELVDGPDFDPHAPCHPDPERVQEWAAATDADRANMAVWREMVDESKDKT